MKKSLVVLAAGMGSRYGGLKQMDPIGPAGEFILDYSVGDALQAGFERIVFVIRPDIEQDFRRLVGARWEKRTDVRYAYQKGDDVPAGFAVPPERKKPWGTAHAVLAARNDVPDGFAVVNADDYYGAEALRLTAGFLDSNDDPTRFCMVAYRLDNTLSEFSSVSRGVCTVSSDRSLATIQERLTLRRCPDGIIRDGDDPAAIPGDTPVSMNMWGFKHDYLEKLERDFPRFLEKYGSLPKSEFQVPTTVATLLKRKEASVSVLQTNTRWFGITSREDRPAVEAFFKTLPSPLS
ncbi:MAG: NTP transferase domain-containing protein [Kiritimatiellia bacterium]